MARSSGPQQNYSAWDAPTQPPRLPDDAIPPPPLPPELTSPLPGSPPPVPLRRKAPITRRFGRGGMARRVLLIVLLAALLVGGLLAHRLWDFGSAISTQNPLSTQTGYMTTGDRINLLILGYGGGDHNGPNLTDSMIVVSINPKDNATTMISVPRDLWVQVPPQSGNYAKLNTAYENGLANGYNGISASPAAGGAEAARKVSDVTGMPVQYWLTINFDGFRGLVDALGGVDINVPVGWTATNLGGGSPGSNTATFKAGLQHMDGERALQYARARYITSPASEGSDFARSRRQLLLIHAIIDRARSVGAVPELPGVMDALQQTLYTNLSLTDLTLLAKDVNIDHAALIGLSDDNVLVDAVSDDGQDILEPANGDWGVIQRYINDHLKK